MALIRSSGAENGSAAADGFGSVQASSIVTAPVHSGTKSWQFTGGEFGNAAYLDAASVINPRFTDRDYYLGAWVRVSALPSATKGLMAITYSGVVDLARIDLQADGKLVCAGNVSAAAIVAGQWCAVEVRCRSHSDGTGNRVLARLDGVDIGVVTNAGNGTLQPDGCRTGCLSSNSGIAVYNDGIVFNDATGVADNSWPLVAPQATERRKVRVAGVFVEKPSNVRISGAQVVKPTKVRVGGVFV